MTRFTRLQFRPLKGRSIAQLLFSEGGWVDLVGSRPAKRNLGFCSMGRAKQVANCEAQIYHVDKRSSFRNTLHGLDDRERF